VASDPVARLLAAIEQAERIARAAGGDRWYQDGKTGEIIATNGKTAENCAGGYWTGIAEHIERHDPETALRQCSADRKLLAIHTPQENGQGELVCGCCGSDTLDGDRVGEWPCETLLTRFEAYGLEVTG
jgi:hypothetical protein